MTGASDEQVDALRKEIRRTSRRARRLGWIVRGAALLIAGLGVWCVLAADSYRYLIACGPFGSSESLTWPGWARWALRWGWVPGVGTAGLLLFSLRRRRRYWWRERRRLGALLGTLPPEQQAEVLSPFRWAGGAESRELAWALKQDLAEGRAAGELSAVDPPTGRGNEASAGE
jgi:hypothetical protein